MPDPTRTTPPIEIAKVCGNTGSMRLLVIGLTTPTDTEILGADAIRLVTIDFDQSSATIMTLPALLWVDTPTLAEFGVEQTQLNLVYNTAFSAAKGNPKKARDQKATQAMAQTIIDNFGFVPDHYITVDEGSFVKYVDALGGIEINLPQAVDGTSEDYGVYPAGPQLLDGRRALNFARLFHPGGVTDLDIWGNLERQNLVVKGILAATLKPQNWTKLPSLLKEVNQAIVTDLSVTQTLDLACMAGKVGENARMLAIGEDMVKVDGLGRMIPNVEAIRRFIAQMDDGD
jgi:LCP family protein required for cell wall assembly